MRLTPMYSLRLVRDIIGQHAEPGVRVLDPFCGTGTTALVAAELGHPAVTTDINPFLLWMAAAKTRTYSPVELVAAADLATSIERALLDESAGTDWIPPIANVGRWWASSVLAALSRAWRAIREAVLPEPARDLLTVAFLRIVIEGGRISFGHQSMSFREDDELGTSIPELAGHWRNALGDVLAGASSVLLVGAVVRRSDARDLAELGDGSADLVISSPPYCNRMSYIRELRPQMYWLGLLREAREAGELDWLAIGGTWGIATSRVGQWEAPLGSLEVPFDGFERIVEEVGQRSDVLGRYIRKFFIDLTQHVRALARVVSDGGQVHYIVGNSKFFDTMVPMEQILAATFDAYGFTSPMIETLRKRSSKRELFEFHVSARRASPRARPLDVGTLRRP
jgi:SAM-dependent methyltransferase